MKQKASEINLNTYKKLLPAYDSLRQFIDMKKQNSRKLFIVACVPYHTGNAKFRDLPGG